MPDRIDIVELGEACLGDDIERLASRVRQEVEVKLLHLAVASAGDQVCNSLARTDISRPVEKGGEIASGSLGADSRTASSPRSQRIVHSRANRG
jgi:hypothetical protein